MGQTQEGKTPPSLQGEGSCFRQLATQLACSTAPQVPVSQQSVPQVRPAYLPLIYHHSMETGGRETVGEKLAGFSSWISERSSQAPQGITFGRS